MLAVGGNIVPTGPVSAITTEAPTLNEFSLYHSTKPSEFVHIDSLSIHWVK